MKHLQDITHLRDNLKEKTCIAFSGGVDSSLLARLVYLQGYNLSLISVYFGECNEIEYTKRAAETLDGNLYNINILLEELEI